MPSDSPGGLTHTFGNCVEPSSCPAGTGKDASHYLMSWYYAWGGFTDTSGGWARRIGASLKSTFYGMYYDQQPVHHDIALAMGSYAEPLE